MSRQATTRIPVSGLHGCWPVLCAAALLSACATPPMPAEELPPAVAVALIDETAMLPLLDYSQRLQRMSPQELQGQRAVLEELPSTPATDLRLAMLLAQPRGPLDLVRALRLLQAVLSAGEPAALSVHPLARTLATQYRERLQLVRQRARLRLQLQDSEQRGDELQDKLDALTAIERSLPVRPTGGSRPQGIP